MTGQGMSPPPLNLTSAKGTSTNVTSPAVPPAPTERSTALSSTTRTTYHYEYLSDERIASWRAAGRKAVIEAGAHAQTEGDTLMLSSLFQELVRAGLDGKLDPRDVGAVVQEILASPFAPGVMDPVSLFLDCVSILTEADASHPDLKIMLSETGIDPQRMRAELETSLLIALPLVRPTFLKMAIRKGTHALYRQSAYNLLREESEGYSKLMTEYFTTVNSEPPSDATITDTFQRVKALIGAFDLDVGRVLDITLDVFANLLVKHFRFFIKLLRKSSWWPEQKTVEGIEWQDQGFSSLPSWALPGSPIWHTTEEEKARLTDLRTKRDQKFWSRVQAVGMNAFFELGSRQIISDVSALELNGEVTDMEMADSANASAKKKKDEDIPDSEKIQKWNRLWITSTRTLPPPGNRIAAQLLGFKLRFYASDARDPHDTLPDNLIFLAALLIKIGFMSLVDLYPHLYPPDEAMPALKERLLKEKAEREKKSRSGGANNALANAGALSDDTVPASVSRLREADSRASSKPESLADKGTPTKTEEEEKEKLPEPADQKTHLLRSLLCIGALPEALYILGRFPWLLEVYPDLSEYVHRLLHHSLSKVYEPARPLADDESASASKKSPTDESISKGQPRASDFPPRKTLRWAQLEKNDSGDGIDYRFYWEDWADNVPVCQSVDDVFLLSNTLFNLVGVKVGQDPTLLIKMARIGRKSLSDDPSESNTNRWVELSKRLLAPALSFTKRNPGVVNEMFEFFKCFPTHTRYAIYAHWYVGPVSRLPDMKAVFAQVGSETRDVLKRISRTNIKPMARALAKAAYGSPGIVFQIALHQIESYENLIDVVVECGRYFTYLAYDVLTWSLLNSLRGGGRERVQADGMLTSSWLRALAAFAGKVFKRYNVMSPTPVLQYVSHQLRLGSPTDLEVLEQILVSMAGIRSDVVLNDAQIQGMSGGELLRAHTLQYHLGDKRHEAKSPSKRLMRSLIDTGLAAQLLIAIAQERQAYAFRDAASDAPLKVLGSNLDKIHQLFAQFLDVLRSSLPVKDFDAAIPDVVSLISEFGIEPSIAFTISRESISHAVAEAAAEVRAEKAEKEKAKKEKQTRRTSQDNPQTNGDVEMGDATVSGVNGEILKSEESAVDADMKDTPNTTESASPMTTTPAHVTQSSDDPYNPVLKGLMDRLRPVVPSDFEQRFSLSFYVTFWQLSLHDLIHPTVEYEAAIKSLRDMMPTNENRRDVSIQGVRKREAEKKHLLDAQDQIRLEMKAHIQTYSEVRKRLKDEKFHWFDGFPMVDAKSEALHDALLQDCFLPRIMLSSQDAHFSFIMLKYLHSSGVPGFRTMKFLDQFFRQKQLTALIFQCTARESENLGRFLNELLKELKGWHADKAVYTQQAQGANQELPGFGRTFKPDRTPATFVDFEDFRRVLYKWHSQLFRALEACLKGGEYMHIRNSINILKAVTQSFPVVDFMGEKLNKAVEDLSNSDSREDLKLSAQSLLGDFKRGQKNWQMPQAFHVNKSGLNPPRNASRSNSERPATPQPPTGSSLKPLNATAPEFAPRSISLSNGVSKPAPTAKEVEDGEVEDEKRQSISGATTGATQPQEKEPPMPAINSIEHKLAIHLPSEDADSARPTSQPPEGKLPPNLPAQSSPSITIAARPDSRGATSQSAQGRTPHALPNRPEAQPPRNRPSDRPVERPAEYHGHNRHDGRNNANPEYGRLDRPENNFRDPFPDRRDQSPGRRNRPRTPPERGAPMDRDRRDPGWVAREYQDDRVMRPPPRDLRAPGARDSGWGENPRDSRGRPPMDSRGPPPPPDSRSRMHSGAPMPPPNNSTYHGSGRDAPPNQDRTGFKQQIDRPSGNPPPYDRPPNNDRPGINPDRAALIEGDNRGRPENFRSDRDGRRDRGSRPHSPRRGDERGPPFPPRSDVPRDPRDHRDDRGLPLERPPPHGYPSANRDRRDEPSGNPPTGPRGGRNEFSDAPAGRSRDLFQNTHTSRPPGDPNHGRLNQDYPLPPRPQAQDPNYGRLNASTDSIPSGPRGRNGAGRGGRNFTAPQPHSSSRLGDSGQIPSSPAADRPLQGAPFPDRRERDRREAGAFDQTQSSAPPTPATEQPPQDMSNIHPSRQNKFQDLPLQTDIPPPPPSGPRGSQRTPHAGPGPSPSTRGPPTGPALTGERIPRTEDKRFAGIHNVLSQNTSGSPNSSFERNERSERNPDRGASIRGRANRPGGHSGTNNSGSGANTSPAISQPSTPNASRLDAIPSRLDNRPDLMSGRGAHGESSSQDDGRSDSRNRREGRRSERSGRHRSSRSRSPAKGERRGEERVSRGEEPEKEKPAERERGSGREKRGGGASDRDGGRRERGDRERDGERGREGRERRERGTRDDGRRDGGPGRGEEQGPRRGGPPMTEGEMPIWGGEGRGDVREPDRNGDTRPRGGGERREDRERREARGEGRDGRKRVRGGDEGSHGDNKRTRRSN